MSEQTKQFIKSRSITGLREVIKDLNTWKISAKTRIEIFNLATNELNNQLTRG